MFRHSTNNVLHSRIIVHLPASTISISRLSKQAKKSKTIFDRTPKSIHPFIRLSRLDRPTGSWVIFFPGAWSIAFAGLNPTNLALIGLFGVGTVLMRGAGCTINDIWDREFDRRVQRTKTRPLASGELNIRQAIVWTSLQLSASFLILLQLNLPTILIGIGSIIPVLLYPLAKRYTYWPQIFLGLTLNWFVRTEQRKYFIKKKDSIHNPFHSIQGSFNGFYSCNKSCCSIFNRSIVFC